MDTKVDPVRQTNNNNFKIMIIEDKIIRNASIFPPPMFILFPGRIFNNINADFCYDKLNITHTL